VSSAGAHRNLVLRRLLVWAVDSVQDQVDVMERSHAPFNSPEDIMAKAYIDDAKAWLKEAREAL
jgi:hypothetical protein